VRGRRSGEDSLAVVGEEFDSRVDTFTKRVFDLRDGRRSCAISPEGEESKGAVATTKNRAGQHLIGTMKHIRYTVG
jgi:hypothetical protein